MCITIVTVGDFKQNSVQQSTISLQTKILDVISTKLQGWTLTYDTSS